MKIRIELDEGEEIQDAEDQLETILKSKKDVHTGEKYADDHLNDFEKLIEKKHQNLIEQILNEIKEAINADIKRHT